MLEADFPVEYVSFYHVFTNRGAILVLEDSGLTQVISSLRAANHLCQTKNRSEAEDLASY